MDNHQVARRTEPRARKELKRSLDEKGEKISKSKGNGLTVGEWLRYAPAESLSLFMYHAPKRAKRLYFDVIPRHVDEYLTFLEKYETEDEPARLENPRRLVEEMLR